MIRYAAEASAGSLIIIFALLTCHGETLREKISGFLSESGQAENRRPEKSYWIRIVLVLTCFAFALFYKVREIPVPYNVDESGTTYDALSLLHYGVDRYLYKNPVYFINFGGGQSALYTYLTVFSIRLFGYSVLSVRLPAIVFSLLSAFCFARMMRKRSGENAAVLSLALFCMVPFSIMHSRWGLDAFLLFPMLIISCTALYEAVSTQKKGLFLLTGLLYGITLYTYAISYIFLPLFLALLLPYLLKSKKIGWVHLFIMGIPLFILAVPLMLMLAVNRRLISEIRTPLFSIPRLLVYRRGEISFGSILPYFRLSRDNIFYRLLINDKLGFNTVPRFGTLFHFSLPFIIFGFVLCIRNGIKLSAGKDFPVDFMVLCAFISALFTSLLIKDVNVNKANEIYFPLIWFVCTGIGIIWRKRKPACILAFAIYAFLSGSFLHYYFTGFPAAIERSWEFSSVEDLKEALDFANSIEKERKQVIIIGRDEPYINTLLTLDVDPYSFSEGKRMNGSNVTGFNEYEFMRQMQWSGIPENPVYIFRDIMDIPWVMDVAGFETRDFGTMRVFYSP